MKIHTTNYFNTFIEVAEDCPVEIAEIPSSKGDEKTAATIQFEMISQNPYRYSSDDVLFQCFATKKDLIESELPNERANFFSKGQPCFRASPLTKRYGWGIHNNSEGKIALFGLGSAEYVKFSTDENLAKTKAMRSKKA